MAENFSTAILEKFSDKKLATISLNRPEKRNAINRQVGDDILAALENLRAVSETNRITRQAENSRHPPQSCELFCGPRGPRFQNLLPMNRRLKENLLAA